MAYYTDEDRKIMGALPAATLAAYKAAAMADRQVMDECDAAVRNGFRLVDGVWVTLYADRANGVQS